MSEKNLNPYFDPDEVVISKDHLRQIIDAILDQWKKNPQKNWIQIKALQTFRLSLRLQSDETISHVFKSIIKVTNEMQMLNAMLRLRDEAPSTQQLLDLTIRRLNEGKIV